MVPPLLTVLLCEIERVLTGSESPRRLSAESWFIAIRGVRPSAELQHKWLDEYDEMLVQGKSKPE